MAHPLSAGSSNGTEGVLPGTGIQAQGSAILKCVKRLSLVLLLLGVFAMTFLVAQNGFNRVGASVLSVGYWGFIMLMGWQLLVASVVGTAWRVVALDAPRLPCRLIDWRFIWARLVRDASASCLPFSQLGGIAIGARALVLRGRTWSEASTSTIGDMTAEFLAQLVFTVATLPIVAGRLFDPTLLGPWVTTVAFALLAGGGGLLLPPSVARLCGLLAGRIAARGFGFRGARLQNIEAELQRMYGRVGCFAIANSLHVLGWITKGVGGWFAFRLLGSGIGLPDALAIEALLYAGLAFAGFVPGHVGIQEGGYVLLGALFGVSPEISLAVSLLRRGRDIAIGIPVLLIWQLDELRRVRTTFR
jgi:glycosyltransferase 2 family protein